MEASAQLASRAMGAGFFTLFGAAWLLYWAHPFPGPHPLVAAAICLAAAALLWACVRQYRRHRGALAAVADTPQRRRSRRVFHVVNTLQWIAILVVGNVLNHTGHGEWILAAVILIVGLHMFPLAAAFAYRPHYVTGLALVLLALAYPLLAPGGPADLSAGLGAGIILWLSAAWALKPSRPRRGA
ncbi:MAG TPA: hypothetical protein VGP06_13285 [Janthinobacterium sp.]|jgi:hypothetical protein|nr:hypothetical protein [Janthinobacterium sp.]